MTDFVDGWRERGADGGAIIDVETDGCWPRASRCHAVFLQPGKTDEERVSLAATDVRRGNPPGRICYAVPGPVTNPDFPPLYNKRRYYAPEFLDPFFRHCRGHGSFHIFLIHTGFL
jgi:hypothetical protein